MGRRMLSLVLQFVEFGPPDSAGSHCMWLAAESLLYNPMPSDGKA